MIVVVADGLETAARFSTTLGFSSPRTILVSTSDANGLVGLRGLRVREDQVVEHVHACRGLYYDSYRQLIETLLEREPVR